MKARPAAALQCLAALTPAAVDFVARCRLQFAVRFSTLNYQTPLRRRSNPAAVGSRLVQLLPAAVTVHRQFAAHLPASLPQVLTCLQEALRRAALTW